MKKLLSLILLSSVLLPLAGHGTILPLTQNNWNNPQFVDRFLGTYGVDSKKEPQITEELERGGNSLEPKGISVRLPPACIEKYVVVT